MEVNSKIHSFLGCLFFGLLVVFTGCERKENPEQVPTLFVQISPEESGITFENTLPFSQEFNVYTYRNYYNGGGVALGDVNNDGLIDIYLTSNADQNKLYLNKGDFHFEDITGQAGVGGNKAWSTGVTMVDINHDGLLDIYVCNSGDVRGDNKQNELYINNGDLSFSEKAAEYGLDDKGYSTHASFFDFDKDGDLDAYLLNNSYQAIGSFNLRKNERPKRDILGGDKLMENVDGKFVDISEKAGIYGSVIGFGLGVTVGDTNNDGWEDIYVSNDFFERDYLYINQQNGTFKEVLTEQINSLSGASMGADLADINNDGNNDIFITEMLPSDYERLKSVTTFEDWNKYQYNVKNGYYHQFTRNMLQLNNGNGSFSEIGRLSGVEASDWSWGALFFDMDNDGFKDLFIANGIYQDLTDQDYLQYISNEEIVKSMVSEKGVDYKKLIEIIPSNKVPNHAYKNVDGMHFQKYEASGLLEPSFSNGSAYGDLDNDGDLDLVVNNVNMPFFLYKNQARELTGNHFLKIELRGSTKNRDAIGSRIKVMTEQDTFYAEQQPIRGFQSSMDNRPNFGIGNAEQVTVEIQWPNGAVSHKENLPADQIVEFNIGDTLSQRTFRTQSNKLFREQLSLPYVHKESSFVDFNRDRLLNHMISTEGPKLALGDVNGDGFTDVYMGAAKGELPNLLLGTSDGFQTKPQPDFEKHQAAEDAESVFFDADQDGDLDLYVCSGSVEYTSFSSNYFDRLYFNDGKGNFRLSDQQFPNPQTHNSTSTVSVADIDQDGDFDLFVGERAIPGKYGVRGSGFILINDGKGNFEDQSASLAPQLADIGMITASELADLNGDTYPDLIVVGEFMDITFFQNKNGAFHLSESAADLATTGWYNSVKTVDIDGDGDLDVIAGNHGLNSRFKATAERPIKLYVKDFDQNGTMDPILCFTADNGKEYPYALRHDLIDQIKSLKKKFPDYKSFKNATLEDIFSTVELQDALVLTVNHLETTLLINEGDFNFKTVNLPYEAQITPVYAIQPADFDGDGDIDLVLGGNLYKVKPEVGRYDASFGIYLENTGALKFKHVPDNRGLYIRGEIRDIGLLPDKSSLLFSRNNDSLILYKLPGYEN